MFDRFPELLLRHRRVVGGVAILIAILTWAVDLTGLVYECPFCRSQRTVIGLLGLLLLMPNPANWLVRYLSAIFAAFGLPVASTQHFRGWANIMSGEFTWGERWYIHPWMLSGFAIGIITGLLLLIWIWKPDQSER